MTDAGEASRPRERCDECGFDAAEWDTESAVVGLEAAVDDWRRAFEGLDQARLTTRPSPQVWSAVEYSVHTAEIVAWWAAAIERISRGEVLTMEPEGYPDADRSPFNDVPAGDALDRLAESARLVTSLVRQRSINWEAPMSLARDEETAMWRRYGVYDAADALLHGLHDALHHLDDVRRDLAGR